MPEPAAPRRGWGRLGAGLLALGAAAVGVRWVAGDWLEPRRLLALLEGVQERAWALPAFLLAYALLTSAFVPAALFHLVAGATWGFAGGLALSLVACNTVALAQFLAARALGRAQVARLLERYRLAAFDTLARRDGVRATLLLRFLPLPFLVANAAGGVSALRVRDFALGTLLATLPLAAAQTYFALRLKEGVQGADAQALWKLAAAGLLLVLASWAPRLWRRRQAARAPRA